MHKYFQQYHLQKVRFLPPSQELEEEALAITSFTAMATEALSVQPLLVTTTVYIPSLSSVTLFITGFCKAETKPSGPVHAYVPPPADCREIFWPRQTVVEIAVAVAVVVLTTTFTLAVDVQPEALVTVTV
jgi:hypothetical protein